MQMDLLREKVNSSKQGRSAPRKKDSPASPVDSMTEIQTIDPQTLPPLPESLRPPFTGVSPDEGDKSPGAFKNISEAAEFLDVPQHVLRFWESRFPQIKPLKMRGGRRYYRPEDMDVLVKIKTLLYKQGYTINGAKKAFALRKPAEQEQAVANKPQPSPGKSTVLTDKKRSQLSVLRQELIGLQESFIPHLSINQGI